MHLGQFNLFRHGEQILLAAAHRSPQLQYHISGAIVIYKTVDPDLAVKIVEKQPLADSSLPDNVVGAAMPVALKCKHFQRGINHPVLFFFFQVKKLAVHKVAPVSSSALLRFFMGIVLFYHIPTQTETK